MPTSHRSAPLLSRVLLPVVPDRRPLRIAVLVVGLAAYGASTALMLRSDLGVMPWGVLDQGLSRTFGGEVGTWSIATAVLVLLCWIPLRQRPGLGTLVNVVLVGLSINTTLALVPVASGPVAAWGLLLGGVLLNALATGVYVGAGLGPGPRDGLSIGLARKGVPLRVARTGVELLVLGIGFVLGGTVGWGTLVYALAIGPMVHRTIPAFRLRTPAERAARTGVTVPAAAPAH
ncbi:YczE/YyaS/YitT family protein [Quadrisphaera granulorum]|uniref:membrane protein YczE n=1 Tax=Quadrisphaera granulorum TaxID=317664 RepID=UPI001B865C41|nr:hypothetical protein [Quadrisphaera granulorum]